MLSLRRVLASAFVLATAVTAFSGISGCQTATVPGNVYAPVPDLQNIGLRKLWERRVTMAPGEQLKNTWRVGDSIYVTTSNARVVRLNAAEGTKAWEIDLVNRTYEILRPSDVPGGKNVLVLNRGQAFLVDKVTGDIVLRKPLEFAVNTDPIVIGNTFCVGGVNYFYSLFLDTLGGKKWVTAAPNDAFVARPAIEAGGNSDTAVLASERGKLWRISLSSGDWAWKDRKTNGRVTGGPAIDARAVYVPCLDGNVYAFEVNNGSQLWNTPLQGTLDQNLVLATRSDVLVPTGTNQLYCLSTARGEKRWEANGVKDIGTVAGDRVWVTDSGGTLKALALENGEVLANAPVGRGRVVRNTVDRNVIVVTEAGLVAMYAGR
jgi:outer membrane protein assembly factor BamB